MNEMLRTSSLTAITCVERNGDVVRPFSVIRRASCTLFSLIQRTADEVRGRGIPSSILSLMSGTKVSACE